MKKYTIEELTQIISNKNGYIANLTAEKDRQALYFRQELKNLYNELTNKENEIKRLNQQLENPYLSTKTYRIADVAAELNISRKKMVKELIKAGIFEQVKRGGSIRIHLTDAYKHLGFDITEYNNEPTYQESSFYLYTEFGKQFLINAYKRATGGDGNELF
jgi:hypothetical protein